MQRADRGHSLAGRSDTSAANAGLNPASRLPADAGLPCGPSIRDGQIPFSA